MVRLSVHSSKTKTVLQLAEFGRPDIRTDAVHDIPVITRRQPVMRSGDRLKDVKVPVVIISRQNLLNDACGWHADASAGNL